jgi:hypothetical protein
VGVLAPVHGAVVALVRLGPDGFERYARLRFIPEDVDPHYTGIAAAPAAIDDLPAHPHLDVVPADPAQGS